MFFDRPGVVSKMSDYRRRVLIAQGSLARKVMQRGMRPGGKKGKSSLPGEYPRAQEGSIRRLTVFAYDELTDSVVIGPLSFAKLPSGYQILSGQETIPQLLNEGGVSVFSRSAGEASRKERFKTPRSGRRPKPTAKRKRRTGGIARRTRQERYRIEPRPFVNLTRQAVVPRMAEIADRVPFR